MANKHIQKLNDLGKEITIDNLMEHTTIEGWMEFFLRDIDIRLDGYYTVEDLEAIIIAMKLERTKYV